MLQRLNGYGAPRSELDINSIFLLSKLRTQQRRGGGKIARARGHEVLLQNSIFWTWPCCCIHEFLSAVVAYTRPVQDEVNQHSSMGGVQLMRTPPYLRSYEQVDGYRWRKGQFSLGMWPLMVSYTHAHTHSTNLTSWVILSNIKGHESEQECA